MTAASAFSSPTRPRSPSLSRSASPYSFAEPTRATCWRKESGSRKRRPLSSRERPRRMTRQPAIYLPHGGGPCFFMDPPRDEPTRWVAMEAYLRGLSKTLPQKPSALLIISAHWEMPKPTVLSAAHPGMLYDYSGFPPHTYKLTYPAPGAPELAKRVRKLLADAGIESDEDTKRDYDHGVFIPMKVSFPDADI